MKSTKTRQILATAISAVVFTTSLLADSFTDVAAAGAWNTARWNNTVDAAPYTATYTAGSPVQFTAGTYTFAGMGASINVGNVTLAGGVTVNFPTIGSTFGTGGNVRTITTGAGSLFDLQSQSVSTTAGTGFIKDGAGAWALAGSTYSGGFTLNSGIVIARGVNALGAGGVLNINGGAIGANASRTFTAKYTTINVGGNFQLGVLASALSIATDTANLTFDSPVALGAANRTVTVGANGTYSLNGVVSGAAGVGLTVTRLAGTTGALALGGANTFDGGVTINGGQLNITASGALASNAVLLTGDDAQLRLTGSSFSVANNITISDTGATKMLSAFGTAFSTSYTGAITLNETTSGNFEVQSGASHTLTLAGNISGTGAAGLKKTGSGTLILSGTNNYLGNTILNNGLVRITTSAAIPSGATAGNLVLDGFVANAGTLDLAGNNLTVNGLDGVSSTVNSAVQNDTAGTATLTVGSNDASGSFAGVLRDNSGTGGILALKKTGIGTQTLAGINTYTSTTTINAGKLLVSGSISGSAVAVNNGGTLGGAGGTTGSVSVNSGGTLAPGAGIGTLNTGALTLGSGSAFSLEINTTATTTDLLASSGALALSLANDTALVIDDLAPTAISSGAFTFLTYTGGWNGGLFSVGGSPVADGGLISVEGNQFTIDYDSGGNSVVLTAVPEPGSGLLALAGAAFVLRRRRK